MIRFHRQSETCAGWPQRDALPAPCCFRLPASFCRISCIAEYREEQDDGREDKNKTKQENKTEHKAPKKRDEKRLDDKISYDKTNTTQQKIWLKDMSSSLGFAKVFRFLIDFL